MYYPDLASYDTRDYGNWLSKLVTSGWLDGFWEAGFKVLTVGWLDSLHPYPVGATSDMFKSHLLVFCLGPVFATMGRHECEFCIHDVKGRSLIYLEQDGQKHSLGSCEVFIFGRNKTVFL